MDLKLLNIEEENFLGRWWRLLVLVAIVSFVIIVTGLLISQAVVDPGISAKELKTEEEVEFEAEDSNELQISKMAYSCNCKNRCLQDNECAMASWKPFGEAIICTINRNKICPIDVQQYLPSRSFCKDCGTTLEIIQNAVSSGNFKLSNVALRKRTKAKEIYKNFMASNGVDGNETTLFHSGTQGQQWYMIDLDRFYFITEIRIFGRHAHKGRSGNLKAYLSPSFNENDDFTHYQEILDIPQNSASHDETYEVDRIRCGRFVIFYKTTVAKSDLIFEAYEIEVMGLETK